MHKFSFMFTLLFACFDNTSKFDEDDDDDDKDDGYSNDHECSFTPISGTKLAAYDCNPVLQNTGEDWGGDIGSVGFYSSPESGHQMWYTSSSGGLGSDFAMGHATSQNGSEWRFYENNPIIEREENAWDQDSVAGQVIVWDPVQNQYIMAYQGIKTSSGTDLLDTGAFGMGIATSPDGLNWTKSPQNPVIDFNALGLENFLEPFQPCWPLTITIDDQGELRGYIAASIGSLHSGTEQTSQQCNIYRMEGSDPETWIIDQSAPVFVGEESYDSKGFTSASIVEFTDPETEQKTLYMFYTGFTDWQQSQSAEGVITAINKSLNLATSTDNGSTWVRNPNNPIPIASQGDNLGGVNAQVIGNRIHLWVTDDYDGETAVGYFFYNPTIEDHQ